MLELEVIVASFIREGPGVENEVVGVLDGETFVTGMGRNFSGTWIMIQTADEVIAWIALSQLSATPEDIRTLPVLEESALP